MGEQANKARLATTTLAAYRHPATAISVKHGKQGLQLDAILEEQGHNLVHHRLLPAT